jgi:hypothetical protein
LPEHGGREIAMYRTISRTIAAAALVSAIAVPPSLLAQTDATAATQKSSRIIVEVDNGNWLDVRVYAVRENGAYDRIGTVTSFSSRRLELPRWLTAANIQVQLVAAPIGSTQRYRSPPVMVSIGDTIEWKLTNNLSLSSIMVRAGY